MRQFMCRAFTKETSRAVRLDAPHDSDRDNNLELNGNLLKEELWDSAKPAGLR